MSQTLAEQKPAHQRRFTQLQGQYLACIYAYSRIFKRPPAEADMRRHFEVTAPSVHQMVIALEKAGLIKREPGAPRSIQLMLAPESIAHTALIQTVIISVGRHYRSGTIWNRLAASKN